MIQIYLQVVQPLTACERFSSDLNKIHQWLLDNKLTLNKDKTEYMIIGSAQRISKITNEPKITIGGNEIKRVKVTKTLGVIVDEILKWNDHINNVITKVSRGIGMLRRIKECVPKSTLIKSIIQQYSLTLTIAALSGKIVLNIY